MHNYAHREALGRWSVVTEARTWVVALLIIEFGNREIAQQVAAQTLLTSTWLRTLKRSSSVIMLIFKIIIEV